MNLKSLATLAAAIVASSAWAAAPAETKCGAGSCGKKENAAPKSPGTQEAGCSKKEASDGQKDASCARKDAACSKKDAACAKK